MEALPKEIIGEILFRLSKKDRFAHFGLVNKWANALAHSSPLAVLSIFQDGDCGEALFKEAIAIETDCLEWGLYSVEIMDGVQARIDEKFASSSFLRKLDLTRVYALDLTTNTSVESDIPPEPLTLSKPVYDAIISYFPGINEIRIPDLIPYPTKGSCSASPIDWRATRPFPSQPNSFYSLIPPSLRPRMRTLHLRVRPSSRFFVNCPTLDSLKLTLFPQFVTSERLSFLDHLHSFSQSLTKLSITNPNDFPIGSFPNLECLHLRGIPSSLDLSGATFSKLISLRMEFDPVSFTNFPNLNRMCPNLKELRITTFRNPNPKIKPEFVDRLQLTHLELPASLRVRPPFPCFNVNILAALLGSPPPIPFHSYSLRSSFLGLSSFSGDHFRIRWFKHLPLRPIFIISILLRILHEMIGHFI